MRRDIHHHRCQTCRQEFECPGNLWLNHDGWPEVVCTEYDERQNRECPTCEEAETCGWCGRPGELITDAVGDRLHPACQRECAQREAEAS